mgnify:CR=1 FL=1
MKKFFVGVLVVVLILSFGTVGFAETVEFEYVCYTNVESTFARAKKADSERKFYVRQTSTTDSFPVYYTSRDAYGNVVSYGIYFAASETGRKSRAYHDDYTVVVGGYYNLGAFPYDGVYQGEAGLMVEGRWTP